MIPKVSVLVAAYNEEEYVNITLDSIPRRDDIEVIVRDDCSTDATYERLLRYKEEHQELNLTVLHDTQNHGCFYNVNRLLEQATGEYIHFLDGDDWLYTDEYSRAIDCISGEDCVYIDLRINDGMVFHLAEDTRMGICAPTTRFVRRAFAEGIKFPENEKNAGDWYYNLELMERKPVSKFTGIVAYHYNHPRRGSIYDRLTRGEL